MSVSPPEWRSIGGSGTGPHPNVTGAGIPGREQIHLAPQTKFSSSFQFIKQDSSLFTMALGELSIVI
jgi:hypothetical protein